jgi:hypothetical protein
MVIEKLEHLLEVRIIEAFTAGMSVIEIIRAMGRIQVGPVHTIIRKAGYILGVTTDEHFSSYEIDLRLDKVFTARGYSFVRWCLGCKFEPLEVATALKNPPDEGSESAFHEALWRDFPRTFSTMFGPFIHKKPVPLCRQYLRFPSHLSVDIDWDPSSGKYLARVKEYPEVESVGINWYSALDNLRIAYTRFQELNRLINAIQCWKEGAGSRFSFPSLSGDSAGDRSSADTASTERY